MEKRIDVFIRPNSMPATTQKSGNIRIAYGDKWIDFREDKIVVTSDDGNYRQEIPVIFD